LPEATGRKCTNTLKMIRSLVVDPASLRRSWSILLTRREDVDARPNALTAAFRPRLHRLIAVFGGRGKKDGPILAWYPCLVMDVTVSAEG